MKLLLSILSVALIFGCEPNKTQPAESDQENSYPTIGKIIKLDERLEQYIDPDTPIEIIAEGFDWSEGPLWVADGDYLLFSDVPQNTIHRWIEADGLSTYLTPSGYTSDEPRGGETGSNGLILDPQGRLVLCQHGDRRMARMNAPLRDPKPDFTTLTDNYEGKKYNSPNDANYHSSGQLYFTDPPYGLEKNMADPKKEIDFQGVYRLDLDGKVHLVSANVTRPNGVAFSPDEKTMYVTSSDPQLPHIYAYDVASDGSTSNERLFFDAKHLMVDGAKGLPDGIKVLHDGTILSTAPGGVLFLTAEGEHLGTVSSGEPTSNVAVDDQEEYLYATSDMYVIRAKLK